jgi:hypothetical protein
MYICQETGGYKLADIAKYFGLARYATVSTTISRLKIWMEEENKKNGKSDDISFKCIMLDLTPSTFLL